jgi:hypothetical protein
LKLAAIWRYPINAARRNLTGSALDRPESDV